MEPNYPQFFLDLIQWLYKIHSGQIELWSHEIFVIHTYRKYHPDSYL